MYVLHVLVGWVGLLAEGDPVAWTALVATFVVGGIALLRDCRANRKKARSD